MLSFLFYFLVSHRGAYAAIKEEVDRVVGSRPICYEDINKFRYIDAALKEALRLHATRAGVHGQV